MKKLSLISLLLIATMMFSSCVLQLPGLPGNPPTNDPEENQPEDGKDPIEDATTKDELDDWQDSSSIVKNTASVTVVKGVPTDITSLVGEGFELDGAEWQSECDGIATVDEGTVTGVKYGRTSVVATDTTGNTATITVTVEFLLSTNNGYDFNTVSDDEVYAVESEYEVNRLLDLAIAYHIKEITLDFSAFGTRYFPFEDANLEPEFGNHVTLTKKYYDNAPHILYVEFEYESTAATTFVDKTAENTYNSLANGNMVIRMDKIQDSTHKRADDYEGFAINTDNNGEWDVYNSEELWWALEQNYKPRFVTENSKAELFYERAKMILRDIITDDMDDFDKVVAITEYLTDAVAYDYDSFYAINTDEDDVTTNTCYYLEGVFERGVAVCDGKSKAFVVFCRIEGIECVRDFGSDPYGGAGHAWNYVKLDGEWYMVDTTGTDAAYDFDGSLGEFFGRNIEIMSYDMLLNSVFDHADEYYYSDVHTDITDYSYGASRTADVFANKIYGTVYDFDMNTDAELTAVVEMLLSTELCTEAVLVFVCEEDVDMFSAIDMAIENLESDAEYAIYEIDTDYLYVLAIKNI